jgi:hypothetical protein
MPTYYFSPASGDVTPATVTGYATSYLSTVGRQYVSAPVAVVDGPPPTLNLDDVVERLDPATRQQTRSHLTDQEQRLRPIAEGLVPGLPGEPSADLGFAATVMAWNGYPAGTIVAIRPSAPVQVIAVFDEWTIDAAGQLTRTPSAPATTQPPHVPPKISAAALTAAVTAVSPGQTFADTVLTLTNYVGQYLSMTGLPGVGLLASLLSGFAQQAVDGAFSSGPGLIDAFKQLLQANRIKLENDLAGAVILNYRDNAEIHYRDAWLDQVMNPPDPAAKDIKDKVAKLEDFADKITTDFDGTSDLFTAVDTMRVPDPQPGDVHDVTEAMLKAEGFFYMANVALTLGRQAFNAKYTMDGSDAAAKIAGLVASYSQIYTDYATALKRTVDQQVATRSGMFHSGNPAGEVWIWDDYYGPDPAGALVWSEKCCGSDDCAGKGRDRDGVMAQMRVNQTEQYRKDLHGRFWDGDSQTFDQAVAAMQDNNAKLQKLAQDCG